MKPPERQRSNHLLRGAIAGGLLIGCYVISYAVNSLLGGYWTKPERDSSRRYSFGLSMPRAILWQPACGYYSEFQSDLLGKFYAPLIVMDRRWIHPTKYLDINEDFEWITQLAKVTDIHPKWREKWLSGNH